MHSRMTKPYQLPCWTRYLHRYMAKVCPARGGGYIPAKQRDIYVGRSTFGFMSTLGSRVMYIAIGHCFLPWTHLGGAGEGGGVALCQPNRPTTKIYVSKGCTNGRVVKGVGDLGHDEVMEAGGREFDPRPGHYSRMSF